MVRYERRRHAVCVTRPGPDLDRQLRPPHARETRHARRFRLPQGRHRARAGVALATVAGARTLVSTEVFAAQRPGSVPLYYLPYFQNAALEMTLPAGNVGPPIFMTAMLSGCTVQVYGSAKSPTVTHANARQKYDDAYGQREGVLKRFPPDRLTPERIHGLAEERGNTAATAAIDAMLPAPVGQVGTVRKADYAGKLNHGNVMAAQRRFIGTLPTSQSLGAYEVSKLKMKPKTGAFVYGLRDASEHWSFWYQAAVEVEALVQDKFGGGADRWFTFESAVLGPPERFFP
jgi:hypothetical protein